MTSPRIFPLFNPHKNSTKPTLDHQKSKHRLPFSIRANQKHRNLVLRELLVKRLIRETTGAAWLHGDGEWIGWAELELWSGLWYGGS